MRVLETGSSSGGVEDGLHNITVGGIPSISEVLLRGVCEQLIGFLFPRVGGKDTYTTYVSFQLLEIRMTSL